MSKIKHYQVRIFSGTKINNYGWLKRKDLKRQNIPGRFVASQNTVGGGGHFGTAGAGFDLEKERWHRGGRGRTVR